MKADRSSIILAIISQNSSLSTVLLPSVLANQRNELAGAVLFSLGAALSLDYAQQLLRFGCCSNRNHQTTASFQLRNQWIWNLWSSRRHQNSIVRGVPAPTERAVEGFNCRVVNSELAHP